MRSSRNLGIFEKSPISENLKNLIVKSENNVKNDVLFKCLILENGNTDRFIDATETSLHFASS